MNTSRGDLVDVLMDVQDACNNVLNVLPASDEHFTSARALASQILDSIKGNVTVTNQEVSE